MLDPILVEAATMFPGCCVGCNGQQGPFLDTHVELVGGQRVYLCSRCVRVHGETFGMVSRDSHDRVEQQVVDLQAQVMGLETELAEAQPILSAMARASHRYGIEDD